MSFLSARKKAGLSQAEAASRLGVSGVAVCHWETGKHHPRGKLLLDVARVYGCTVDELLGGEQPKDSTENIR